MNTLMQKLLRFPIYIVDIRVIVAIFGLIMSVVLHELFHIAMHWGHIARIEFFVDRYTIVDIVVSVPEGYDFDLEEVLAYGITALVMLLTVVTVYKIHDLKDKRTYSQILNIGHRGVQKP